jgi:hypothetical protein
VGTSTSDFFGGAVCSLRDVNADGASDLVIAAPGEIVGTSTRGALYV